MILTFIVCLGLACPQWGMVEPRQETSPVVQVDAQDQAQEQGNEESFWAMGQMWADTSSPGYCQGYTPYESHAPAPGLLWPVPGGVLNENRSFRVGHTGLDIIAPVGTPVNSPSGGMVVWAGETDFFGSGALVVAVDHGGGWLSVMAHLSTVDTGCGQWIGRGQQIGTVGTTGAVSVNYPHLHWDLRNGRYSYNPMPHLE